MPHKELNRCIHITECISESDTETSESCRHVAQTLTGNPFHSGKLKSQILSSLKLKSFAYEYVTNSYVPLDNSDIAQ